MTGYQVNPRIVLDTGIVPMTVTPSFEQTGSILAGTPDDICKQLGDYLDAAGDFEFLSMQVNFHMVTVDEAAASMRLFSEKVMPAFR